MAESLPSSPTSRHFILDREILHNFLASARLATYIAEKPSKLRIGPFRVLGHFDAALDLVYTDTYYASDDDTVLRGTEFVLRPGSPGGLRINYSGGFQPTNGCPLSAREVLDQILKPCRRDALSGSRKEQEGQIGDNKYRYRWTVMGSVEQEVITAWFDGQWSTVHQIIFKEDSGKMFPTG